MGHAEIEDHMFLDGLEDAYDRGRLMGACRAVRRALRVLAQDQDRFAIRSLSCARAAQKEGAFAGEIEAVLIKGSKGEQQITEDEQPHKADPERIPRLKPAFRAGGTVTAANSSSISDGAAALVLMKRSEAEARGIRAIANRAQPPTRGPAGLPAPVAAIAKCWTNGWSRSKSISS
jgi:acetyl-CoA C-acetyltransferase